MLVHVSQLPFFLAFCLSFSIFVKTLNSSNDLRTVDWCDHEIYIVDRLEKGVVLNLFCVCRILVEVICQLAVVQELIWFCAEALI